jgi:hypothetical protein
MEVAEYWCNLEYSTVLFGYSSKHISGMEMNACGLPGQHKQKLED